MRICIALLLVCCLTACKSTPEKVRAEKEKFIEVAKQVSQPIDFGSLTNLLEQVKSTNLEGKMKYLDVDDIQTIYGSYDNRSAVLDSVVIFTKSGYKVIYDFASIEKTPGMIRTNGKLRDIEKIDERLYLGRE